MMIQVPAGTVQQTTTTTSSNAFIAGSVADDDVNASITSTGTGLSGNSQAGSLVGHSEASATGVSASIVDQETGETVTATVGLPSIGISIPAATTTVTTTTTGAMVEVECGMSLEDHRQLLETLRSHETEGLTIERIIDEVSASNRLTTNQVVAVLKTLGYEMYRENAAVKFYPGVCDPNSWYKVYDSVGAVTADSIKEQIHGTSSTSSDF